MSPDIPGNSPEDEPTRDEQLWAEAHGHEMLYELLVMREAAVDSINEQGGLHHAEDSEVEDYRALQRQIKKAREKLGFDPYE